MIFLYTTFSFLSFLSRSVKEKVSCTACFPSWLVWYFATRIVARYKRGKEVDPTGAEDVFWHRFDRERRASVAGKHGKVSQSGVVVRSLLADPQ